MVALPEGKDPDEIVLASPESWPAILQGAKPVVEYVLDVLTQGVDLDDSKVKAAIARNVLPLIEDVADPVEREAYRQSMARRLRVDERSLEGARTGSRPARRRRAPADEVPGATAASASRQTLAPQFERFCLGLLLRDPEILYQIDRRFAGLDLDRLGPEDFSGTDSQVVFSAVRSALAQDDEEPSERWRRELAPTLVEQAEVFVAEAREVDLLLPRVQAEAVSHALRLRRRHLESGLVEIRYQLQAAQEEQAAADEVRRLMHDLQRLGVQKNVVDRALAVGEAPKREETGDARTLA